VAALVWPGEKEPVYKGKTLSEWLTVYASGVDEGNTQRTQEASDAVHHIGTNALPWLLKWSRQKSPPGLRARLMRSLFKMPRPIAQRLRRGVTGLRGPGDEEEVLRRSALAGFETLGAEANSGVGELAERLRNPRALSRSLDAARALAYIGKEGFPPLMAALTNAGGSNRLVAVNCIGKVRGAGTNASPAVPVLIQLVTGPDYRMASLAVTALGELALEADIAVPALTNVVGTSDNRLRYRAVLALGDFGQRARPAVPTLAGALEDSDSLVRVAATNALRKIAPELLTNAVAK
jgi:hypothetical protein